MKKLIIFTIFLFSFSAVKAQWSNNFNTGKDMKSVFFIDQNTGWASGNLNTIVKTTNGGNSWFYQNSGLAFTTNFNSVFFYDNQNGFIVGDPFSGTTIIIKTTNGGNNWQLQSVPFANYKLSRVFFIPSGTKYLGFTCGFNAGSNTGIILRTTNYGENWIQTYGSYGKINTLHMIDSTRGYAGGDTLMKTLDGGNNWNMLSRSSSVINDLFFVNNSDGWMCTESGKIYYTKNNGNTWEEQLNNINNQPFKSIFFIDNNTGWASTVNGNIFKTTNAGKNWSRQITGINTSLDEVILISDQVGFAVGEGGKILKTENGGGSFTTVTQTFTRNINKPLQPNLLTSDTIHINSSPLDEYISIVDVNISIDTVINIIDSNLIFVMTHSNTFDTIIYKVGNNGNNFIGTVLDDDASKSIESGHAPFTDTYRPSRPLTQLNNLSLSGDWIINIYHEGNGMNYNPLLTGVIKVWGMAITYNVSIPLITGVGQIHAPAIFTLSQNYPNPFNPKSNIKFDISKTVNVKLSVFDILGREVATLVNELFKPGTYIVDFDGSELSSGIYFYRLTADNFTETKKMILIR